MKVQGDMELAMPFQNWFDNYQVSGRVAALASRLRGHAMLLEVGKKAPANRARVPPCRSILHVICFHVTLRIHPLPITARRHNFLPNELQVPCGIGIVRT
jgi:hypothetical protein